MDIIALLKKFILFYLWENKNFQSYSVLNFFSRSKKTCLYRIFAPTEFFGVSDVVIQNPWMQ